MAAKRYTTSDFDLKQRKEGWTRVAEFDDIQMFLNFVNYTGNEYHKRFGKYAMNQVKKFHLEVDKEANSGGARPEPFAIFLDEGATQKFVSLSRKSDNLVLVWTCQNPPTFRRTNGIVTQDGDPAREADVIMTAAALGLAASYIVATRNPIQFDMDPLVVPNEPLEAKLFETTVGKMDAAVAAYLTKKGTAPSKVRTGTSPGYSEGAIIMGVYTLAGKSAPQSVSAPVLSEKGKALWEQIRKHSVAQYTGRGAYSGFVDSKNTEGITDPVGPRSTVRIPAPKPSQLDPDPHPRWLPPMESPLWQSRKRAGSDTHVPWGMIGGDEACVPRKDTGIGATNQADYATISMNKGGMVFNGDVTIDDIATYTHGMIQAIYKAYGCGPNCEPYEIAVGDLTKKMASCLPCTLFMYATGYPPTSIHLGRGESWTPLFQPYNPNGPTGDHESAVIRDLNNSWYEKCLEWLKMGLEILDDSHITEGHRASRDAVSNYLSTHRADKTVGGVLILDAVTIHAGELDRISRTLK